MLEFEVLDYPQFRKENQLETSQPIKSKEAITTISRALIIVQENSSTEEYEKKREGMVRSKALLY